VAEDEYSMIVFLNVTSYNGKPFGTLQMTYFPPVGEIVSQGWEWIGANATNDGGTWEWNKDEQTFKVSVALTSNLHKRIVSRMFAQRWNQGSFPPLTPWFIAPNAYDWDNELEHYGADGNQRYIAIWTPK
jgi:hypothetical protein